MIEHSPLPPSSSARRIQCNASTKLEALYPKPESDAAREGITAHWGLAETLAGHSVNIGDIAPPTGLPLTREMIEGIDLMFEDVCRELRSHRRAPCDGQIEKPVYIPRIHEASWGTPDYRIWIPEAPPRLLLYDFKYGYRPVEVFENAQLIEYVAGALDEMNRTTDQEVNVTVKIVQPRAPHRDGPIRSWSFRGSDIRPLVNRARNAADAAMGDSPTARVGPECRDCAARHACPTLQAAALSACDVAGAAQPFDLSPPALALEYRSLKRHAALLSARISGLEEQALALARAGTPLPGLRVEHGRGRLDWAVPDAAVIAMGQMLGVELSKPPEAITPKQAVKAGLPESALAGITETPKGELKLVEDDGSLARRIFA